RSGRARPATPLEGVAQYKAGAVPLASQRWRTWRRNHRGIGDGPDPSCLAPAKGPFADDHRLAGSIGDIGNPNAAATEENTLAVHAWFTDAEDADVVGRGDFANRRDGASHRIVFRGGPRRRHTV